MPSAIDIRFYFPRSESICHREIPWRHVNENILEPDGWLKPIEA
ncbi:hypothetical protein VSF3289_01356 [Vibrio scophthalmi]|uniref:Uncharacterized protein n=1 Tax=Vibrio scophthalmi TaxID=45658 RepID=A0A1E3WMT6_9VIBR|nr:hypothetical protein VSF3289_01356 [Vibrio scophthalmi]